MTTQQRSLPVRGNDPEQLRLDITSLERTQDLFDPRAVKPLYGEVLNNTGNPTVILPAPPPVYAWVIGNFAFSNPNASGGSATYKMRLGTAGDLVDQRTIAQSTPASFNSGLGTSLSGGLVAESAVTIEVTAGTSVRYAGEAYLVPLTKVRYWRSPALTDTYQAVTLPEIPTGYCLRMPGAAHTGGQALNWSWVLNNDNASRTVAAQVTRGGIAHQVQASLSVGTLQRTGITWAIPALIAGDTLEIKCTAAPAAETVWVGGAFELVPIETR